ncbi:MAG: hypothetical protein ABIW38_00585 [Ferruginibacter sp.]
MKRIFVISVVVLCGFAQHLSAQTNISSQEYITSVGVKFFPGAVTVKHFLNEKGAIEGLGYFYKKGGRITGLYEFHWDIPNAAGLKWYAGPGAHVGFYSASYGGGSSVGIDGVIGLDYKFLGAPINVSLDWQPSFEFGSSNGEGFAGNWGGLAIRYVF